MLLIDSARSKVASLHPENLPVAAIPWLQIRTEAEAKRVLAFSSRDDVGARWALLGELARIKWPMPAQRLDRSGLISQAARALVMRRLLAAFPFEEPASVTFDSGSPFGSPHEAVVIGSLAVAARMAAWLQKERRSAEAVAAAVAHPSGATHLAALDKFPAGSVPSRLPPQAGAANARISGAGPAADQLTALLLNASLLLVPRDLTSRLFALVWRRYGGGGTASIQVKAPAGPPPAAAASARPPPRPAAARPPLPEAPPDISVQALVLMEAAKRGAPFCEECAKEALAHDSA
jgi:hypothetical protein